jgi:hypothetical protein
MRSSQSSSRDRQLQAETNYQPWPLGTPVYWEFPNEGWWKGTITHFSTHNGVYTVTWEDGTIDYYDNFDEVNQMVAYAQNDPSARTPTAAPTKTGTDEEVDVTDNVAEYPIGTPVAEQENGVWYVGTITNYYDGIYTIRWDGSDGETERFFAGHTLKQMVADAEQASTAVAAGSAATTTTTTTTTPAPSRATAAPTEATVAPTDAIVAATRDTAAPTRATSAPTTVPFDNVKPELWPVGTPVAEYEDGQWWFGKIRGFNGKGYFIHWDDDEVEEIRDWDLVNQMVADADTLAAANKPVKEEETTNKEGKYPVGTPVYDVSQEDGSIRTGVVESYYRGNYGIRWTDNTVATYQEGSKLDEIVAAAAATDAPVSTKSKSGMTGVGKAILSIFLLLLIFGGAYIGMIWYKKNQRKENAEKIAALEEPREDNIVSYRDEPADDTPKIV